MSYDLEIFDGNPEAPEDTFRPLDCRLAWHVLAEFLAHERTERDRDEMVWFLPTRTVSLYLGEEDDTVPSMAASLVWGDRSDTALDLSAPPVNDGNDAAIRADLSKIFITLQNLAEKLGAKLYDPQQESFVERREISRFVEDFNHDDLVRRIAQGEYVAQPGAEPLAQRTSDEAQRQAAALRWGRFKPLHVLAALVILALLGNKFMNRYDRQMERRAVEQGAVEQTIGPRGIGAPADRTVQEAALPSVELWVDANHTLHRSSLQNGGDARMLTWVIQVNGQTVLERNAEGETQYRFYNLASGNTVTAYLKAFVNGRYHTVSNVVSFQIP